MSLHHLRVILLCLPLLCTIATAQPQKVQFEELKKQYMTLRNTDLSLTRADEWVKLARQFEQFADRNTKSTDSPSALLNAAILTQILFKQFGGADRAQKAADLLERIAKNFPGNPLVDDALLKRGDLLLFDLGKEEAARRAFEELARAYPDSELVPVAQSRIDSIVDGTYRTAPPGEKMDDEPLKDALSGPVIVIDPGHGGEDFGAQGVAGLLEKDVVLSVAFQLEQILKEKLNAVVRLTRRSDVFVPLEARTQLANDFDADIFVSLHTNASPSGKASGFEIYYLDNSQDQASKSLAERENASSQMGGASGDLQFMLSDLIQNAKLDDSIIFANLLHQSLNDSLTPHWKGVRGLGVKKAPFYVLVGAHMPCVLVEMFFIDNFTDGPRLAERKFRDALAHSLYAGIRDFYQQQIDKK